MFQQEPNRVPQVLVTPLPRPGDGKPLAMAMNEQQLLRMFPGLTEDSMPQLFDPSVILRPRTDTQRRYHNVQACRDRNTWAK